MHFQGQQLISQATHVSSRTLVTVSLAKIFSVWYGVNTSDLEVIGLQLGEAFVALAPYFIGFLIVNHLLSWLGDLHAFQGWNSSAKVGSGSGWGYGGSHLAPKSHALEEQEAGGALQVSQRLWIDGHQALEIRLGGDLKPQQIEERDIVLLKDAEEVIDLARAVVDEFRPRTRCPSQEYARHADKGLGIGLVRLVRIDQRADAPREIALAADPRGYGSGGIRGGLGHGPGPFVSRRGARSGERALGLRIFIARQRGHLMLTTPDIASCSAQNSRRPQAQQRICSCSRKANHPTFAAPDQGGSGHEVTAGRQGRFGSRGPVLGVRLTPSASRRVSRNSCARPRW